MQSREYGYVNELQCYARITLSVMESFHDTAAAHPEYTIKLFPLSRHTYITAHLRLLLLRDLDLLIIDGGLDVTGALAVDSAANRVAGAENLLDSARELLSHGALTHLAGNLDDLVEGEVSVVDDVLLLLAVTDRLVEGLHDKGGGGGDHRHRRLTIDNSQLDCDAQAFPVHGRLHDILTNLLGGETEGTNLGREGGGRSDLTTYGAHNHNLNIVTRRRAHVV